MVASAAIFINVVLVCNWDATEELGMICCWCFFLLPPFERVDVGIRLFPLDLVFLDIISCSKLATLVTVYKLGAMLDYNNKLDFYIDEEGNSHIPNWHDCRTGLRNLRGRLWQQVHSLVLLGTQPPRLGHHHGSEEHLLCSMPNHEALSQSIQRFQHRWSQRVFLRLWPQQWWLHWQDRVRKSFWSRGRPRDHHGQLPIQDNWL